MNQQLSKEAIEIFDAIAAILLKCFIVAFLALLFVWIVIAFKGDYVYQIQTHFLNVSHQDFDLFVLYALTFMKVLNVVFFLFPYIAIALFLRSQKNNT